MRYAKDGYVLVKKNKSQRNQSFKADMQTIKKEDVRNLQETFNQFFGANPGEMRKNSSRLRKNIFLIGFVSTMFFVVVFYIAKNVKFVGV